MSFEARSRYELEDDQVRQAEAHDHARAGERGERLDLIAHAILDALDARGSSAEQDERRVIVFHVLADHLYGDLAIDLPKRSRRDD